MTILIVKTVLGMLGICILFVATLYAEYEIGEYLKSKRQKKIDLWKKGK
jgi:hypothetical protein